ncbi:MAG TPA: DUF5103 domain-containing protein, partial [Chitinophagaceae bacterium]|nr:DUF5103 domain-containing protein [Chitinophagaceae bacterium]
EYRWVDLRSFRIATERVHSIDKLTIPNEIILKPDLTRSQLRYAYFKDFNGWYFISSSENINPFWQADYANVHFTFIPPNNKAIEGKDVYIMSNFTNSELNDSTKLLYNEEEGWYEKTFLMKQGYYSYTYVTKDKNNENAIADVTLTDGNLWETENDYTVFVYYKSVNGRHDELVGITTVNTRLLNR